MTQPRRVIGLAIVAVPLLLACGGRTERAPNTEKIGSDDAGFAKGTGSRVVDAGRAADVTPDFDAEVPRVDPRDYYCNLPEPGPCCCEPVLREFRAPENEAGVTSCEFSISRGRMPFVPNHINLLARRKDGSELVLLQRSECVPGAAGWMYVSEEPPVVRLCPSTCETLFSGEYEAIVVAQGCPAIVCPPP